MVAAMLAMSVCILCSVSVRLGGVWFILSNAGCRDCLTCWFPLGVGFSRSSSICEMSESAMEEGMSLSPSLASWLPRLPFFCLTVAGLFWLKRKVVCPGGVDDDLWGWGCAGVAGGVILCIGVRIVGPGPWRWSSLNRISGLRAA